MFTSHRKNNDSSSASFLHPPRKGLTLPTLGQHPQLLSLSGACHEDVAASTSRRHAGLSIARRLAVARPKLSGRRSSSTVLSQVCLGLPVLRRQSLGGPRMQARKAPVLIIPLIAHWGLTVGFTVFFVEYEYR